MFSLGMPVAIGYGLGILRDILALALDGHHAVDAPVALEDIGLDGQMRLVLGMEAAFGHHRGGLEELGRILAFEEGLLHVEVGQVLLQLDGVGHHRFGEGHVRGQDLEILLDLLGSRPGILLGIGRDQRHHVTAAADLLAGDDRELREAFALRAGHVQWAGHVVGALDILGGHDLDDAGHGFGFAGVDAEDVGVIGLGEHHGQEGGAVGHRQRDIIAIVGKARHLRESGRPGMPRPVDLRLAGEVVGDVLHRGFTAHDLGGRHHGIHKRLVAGAAADVVVLLEPSAHLVPRGRGVRGQQSISGDDETG